MGAASGRSLQCRVGGAVSSRPAARAPRTLRGHTETPHAGSWAIVHPAEGSHHAVCSGGGGLLSVPLLGV